MPVPSSSSSLAPIHGATKKRRQSNLKDLVRIPLAQEWKEGNQLFDWYTHRSSRFIDKIQLRREHQYPFFHEYVVFNLRDNGGCFRIDRRQCSHGNTSFGRTYNPGVEAHDTMEEVTSFDDTLYGSSDCLIELELEAYIDVDVKLVLDICRAIRAHSQARVYTLQRYNCYFFAQTIIVCAARAVFELYPSGRPINDRSMLKRPPTVMGTTANYLQFKSSAEPLLFHSTRQSRESFPAGAPGTTIPHRSTCLHDLDDFDDSSQIQASSTASILSGTTLRDDTSVDSHTYPSGLTAEICPNPCIHPSCSQFSTVFDSASESVAWQLSNGFNQANSLLRGFWDNLLSSTLHGVATYNPLAQGLWVAFRDSHIRHLWRQAGGGFVRPKGDQLRIRQLWSEFSGHVLDSFLIALLEEKSSSSPESAYSTVPDCSISSKISVALLRENAALNEWRNAMIEFFDSEYENLERALWRRAAVQRAEYSLWCHTATRVTQEGSDGLKQRVQIRLNFAALRPRGIWETYTPGSKASRGPLQLSTYEEMQDFIKELIHAHSTRVEQYKLIRKCTEVKETIRSAMSDIWHAFNNTSDRSNAIPIDLSDFENKLESLKASHLL